MEIQIGPSGPYSPDVRAPQEPPKKSRKKFWIVIGAFLAFILLLFGYIFWQAFDLWLGQRRVVQVAEKLQKAQEEIYQKQLADTYGGKTPQETLRMYIEAVEKGDYELASKYFVIEKQTEEEKSFEGASNENIQKYIFVLKSALDNDGSYSEDKGGFVIRDPVLIDFQRYPNGVWKIVEI